MDYTEADREILTEFEKCIKNKKWSQARSFLSDEFEASWPQYHDKTDADGFIGLVKHESKSNCTYQPFRNCCEHDRWEWITTVICQELRTTTLENGDEEKDFIISEYQIQDEKIIGLIQFFAKCEDSPSWRTEWTEKY